MSFSIWLTAVALVLSGTGATALWTLRRQAHRLLGGGLLGFGLYNGYLASVYTLDVRNSVVRVVIPATVGAYIALTGLLIALTISEERLHPGRALLLGLAGLVTTVDNSLFVTGSLRHPAVLLANVAAIVAVLTELWHFADFIHEALTVKPPMMAVDNSQAGGPALPRQPGMYVSDSYRHPAVG